MSKKTNGSNTPSATPSSLQDTIAPMRATLDQLKKVYVERHEYRAGTDADLKDRDRQWYDASTRELIKLGFRHLGDVVNETLAQAAGLIVVIRRFVSREGTTMAAIYQFVRPNTLPGSATDLRLCDVESEFSDGSFLTSSNAVAAKAASLPSQIRDTKYPAKTTIPQLIALHDAQLRKLLDAQPNLRPVEIQSAADYQAAQDRQQAIKAAFRQGIGYLDPAEIRRIAQQKMPDDPATATIAAASAHIARHQAQMEETTPTPLFLLSLMNASDEGKSPQELANLAAEAMLSRLPGNVPESKRDQIADTMKNLLASVGSDDPSAGMKGLFSLMGQLRELEPKEEKEARRKEFEENMARASLEHEKRQADHVKERLSRGLSEKPGTGEAGPEVFLHALPIPELDYQDKPRALGAMINEINASKARRDAKILADMPIGHSRVGGLPDLPPDHPWPTHNGRKVPFVAQINLANCPKSVHAFLPKRGHLYVFALISNEKEHWPPPASVFLYEGETSSLIRAATPRNDEIWPDWGDERIYEIFPATTAFIDGDPKKRSWTKGETLGWLFGQMSEVFGTPGEIADGCFKDGDDWINLLAVHSVGSMQWSDAGHLYVLIRRSALKARDFSKVLAAACSS